MSGTGLGDENRQKQEIELFKFFESKGFQDKQQMMSLMTFLFPLVFGLFAYCWRSIFADRPPSVIIVCLASLAAVIFSSYALLIVHELVIHANWNLGKARKAAEKAVENMTTVENLPNEETEKLGEPLLKELFLSPPPNGMLYNIRPFDRLFCAIRCRLDAKLVTGIFIAFYVGAVCIFVISLLNLICAPVLAAIISGSNACPPGGY